jgi:hypothetical protein
MSVTCAACSNRSRHWGPRLASMAAFQCEPLIPFEFRGALGGVGIGESSE